jgi:hypothetical protein
MDVRANTESAYMAMTWHKTMAFGMRYVRLNSRALQPLLPFMLQTKIKICKSRTACICDETLHYLCVPPYYAPRHQKHFNHSCNASANILRPNIASVEFLAITSQWPLPGNMSPNNESCPVDTLHAGISCEIATDKIPFSTSDLLNGEHARYVSYSPVVQNTFEGRMFFPPNCWLVRSAA